ncbi:hypothetical protein T440DRAFT_58991 [Plenodomus tracheiphilus IPT5]|uniref:Uncharacterized protein n=1 Tax=Plenodomus tracheiphilus IPT5 TaxID=1408161 RepID=A0A6A7B8W5_9PLEO|nr:hypothetical protein T440DRAFT_58991 [Plenodomus tracheiphilus IPT5]
MGWRRTSGQTVQVWDGLREVARVVQSCRAIVSGVCCLAQSNAKLWELPRFRRANFGGEHALDGFGPRIARPAIVPTGLHQHLQRLKASSFGALHGCLLSAPTRQRHLQGCRTRPVQHEEEDVRRPRRHGTTIPGFPSWRAPPRLSAILRPAPLIGQLVTDRVASPNPPLPEARSPSSMSGAPIPAVRVLALHSA